MEPRKRLLAENKFLTQRRIRLLTETLFLNFFAKNVRITLCIILMDGRPPLRFI